MAEQDDAAKKAEQEAAAKKAADDAKAAEDAQLAAIMKDPEAVKSLLEAKRAANAEAKELRLKQEAADKLKKEQEETALKEQKKFQELAERKDGENKSLRDTASKRFVDLSLKEEAKAAGALDEDAIIALVVRTDIKVGEDFSVTGTKEAVEALKKAKPHLFGTVDKKVPPPATKAPAPRAGFISKPGDATTAHEDLSAGFKGK